MVFVVFVVFGLDSKFEPGNGIFENAPPDFNDQFRESDEFTDEGNAENREAIIRGRFSSCFFFLGFL